MKRLAVVLILIVGILLGGCRPSPPEDPQVAAVPKEEWREVPRDEVQ